ncbi:hypothetical protein D3C77_425790 [compost metagenome]
MALSLISITACSPNTNVEATAKTKTVVQCDCELVKFDKNQLVHEADVIVYGTVIAQEVQKDFGGLPATDTTLKVHSVYKGEPDDTVEIRVRGGEIDDMIYTIDEYMTPTFKIGEEAVVFLTSNKGTTPDKEDFGYYVVGQSQGKFNTEATDPQGLIYNQIGTHSFDFNNIQQEIDEIEEYNKVNNLQRLHSQKNHTP